MEVLFGCVLFAFLVYLYFIPSIVANNKKRKDITAIFVLNLLLGWTFVGWVVALVWAAKTDDVAVTVVQPAPTSDMRICPNCAETVKAAANVCKHCHGELTPTVVVSTTTPEVSREVMPSFAITDKR